ncbi:MAG TPA: hypothetical protein VF690_03005 [Hymenobacter sp.]|jgi:hypothetical protein
MKNLLKPRETMICQLADGHQVRVVDYDHSTEKMRVKSLRTGLPLKVHRTELFELDKPAD